MMQWYAYTDDMTGRVRSTLYAARRPSPRPGTTIRTVSGDMAGLRWTAGDTYVPITSRRIPLEEFLDRITIEEHAAFETLMESSATARAWWARLNARRTVNLDREEMVRGWAFVKSAGVPSIWPDEAMADARIAELLA